MERNIFLQKILWLDTFLKNYLTLIMPRISKKTLKNALKPKTAPARQKKIIKPKKAQPKIVKSKNIKQKVLKTQNKK